MNEEMRVLTEESVIFNVLHWWWPKITLPSRPIDWKMSSPVIPVGEPKKRGRFVKQPAGERLPAWQSFLFSTIAPQLAVLFTNPFDTAKVREKRLY